jgi:pyruvate formate lyase activating enzyme
MEPSDVLFLEKQMQRGLVFNVQRFSLQDGPGLRSTVFLKGCPLACAWCHNPESQAPQIQFIRLGHRCMACGICSEEELADPLVRRRDASDVEACPTGALQAVGQELGSADLVRTLLRDRIFFDESGGGVTFSGGEPLLQTPFVVEAMRLLRAEGVHTALDTCGYGSWPDLAEAASHASLVLYDLKLMDEVRHKAATGVSNAPILQNLRNLSGSHPAIWARIPIIPGINNDRANLEATAEFLGSLPGIQQVDLLPYHPMGESKSPRVGIPCQLHAVPTPTVEDLEAMAALFRAKGLHATIGGRP